MIGFHAQRATINRRSCVFLRTERKSHLNFSVNSNENQELSRNVLWSKTVFKDVPFDRKVLDQRALRQNTDNLSRINKD